MKFLFKMSFACLMPVLFLTCCKKIEKDSGKNDLAKYPAIRDSVFVSSFGGYGYDIIVDDEVVIHQPHIPVIAGRSGFRSAGDARKTAKVVMAKLKQNQFPPEITRTELTALDIVQPAY